MAEKPRKSRWSKKSPPSSEEEGESSEEEEEEEEESPPPIENKFANDGSFLELFKKKMAEEKANAPEPVPVPVPRTETEDGETQLKAYQDGVGRRKTLLKTQELREKRKRRREEIEEQKKQEENGPQSTAWKTYMKQVKEFKEKCCSEKDDIDYKRPLVK